MDFPLLASRRSLPARRKAAGPAYALRSWDRRVWAYSEGALYVDGTPIALRGTADLGPALDAMLVIAGEGALDALPAEARATLLSEVLAVLAEPAGGTADPPLLALQRDGLRLAAAGVLLQRASNLAEDLDVASVRAILSPGPSTSTALSGRRQSPALATLLAVAARAAGLGPHPGEPALELADHARWLLEPKPTFACQEDRYELVRDEVGLLWCGLARCTDADAFIWLRSGYILLHSWAPEGSHLAPTARRLFLDRLARQPGPSSFRDWQDEIYPYVRGLVPTDDPGDRRSPPPLPPLALSTRQAELWSKLSARQGAADALEACAQWFPEARANGAVTPVALRAALRVAGSDQPIDDALALEAPLHHALRTARDELRHGRLGGVTLPVEAIPVLLELLRRRIDTADDVAHLIATLQRRAHRGALSLDHWLPVDRSLSALTAPHPDDSPYAAPLWRALDRMVDSTLDEQDRWWVEGEPVAPHRFPQALAAVAGSPLRATALAEALCSLAGLIHASQPQTLHIDVFATDDAPSSVVLGQGAGAVQLDTNGRPSPASPPSDVPWFQATIEPDGTLSALVTGDPPGRAPAWPLDAGDDVRLPSGEHALLSELRPDGGAVIHRIIDGTSTYQPALLSGLVPAEHRGSLRRWVARWRAWLGLADAS